MSFMWLLCAHGNLKMSHVKLIICVCEMENFLYALRNAWQCVCEMENYMRLGNGKLSYQLSADLTTLWQRWNGFGTLRKGLRYREERIDASRFIEMCILIHWFIHQDEYNILWTWARFDSSFSFRHSNFEFLITSRPQAHTVFRLAFYDNMTTWWRW